MSHIEKFIDGVWHPSVTTVMDVKPKPWIDAWRDKWGILAERKMRMSQAIGDEFHRCVEAYILTGIYTVQPATVDGVPLLGTAARIEGMMKSFVKWAASINGVIEHTELNVVSRTYKYSGTLDAVGKLGRKNVIFDWKTSSRIYDDMQLQLAAYAQAYNEEHAVHPSWVVKDGLIVHVAKEKPHHKLTTKMFKLGKRPFGKFLELREMFDDVKEREALNAEISDGEATGC